MRLTRANAVSVAGENSFINASCNSFGEWKEPLSLTDLVYQTSPLSLKRQTVISTSSSVVMLAHSSVTFRIPEMKNRNLNEVRSVSLP